MWRFRLAISDDLTWRFVAIWVAYSEFSIYWHFFGIGLYKAYYKKLVGSDGADFDGVGAVGVAVAGDDGEIRALGGHSGSSDTRSGLADDGVGVNGLGEAGGGGNVTTSGGTVSLKHGVAYNISGTYNSGYEFSSWATAANGTLGSTSAASTTYTVTGTSTLTLTGKSSKLYMQNMAASDCTTTVKTVYDNRDETAYHVQRLADGNCWMLDNLVLVLPTTLF